MMVAAGWRCRVAVRRDRGGWDGRDECSRTGVWCLRSYCRLIICRRIN